MKDSSTDRPTAPTGRQGIQLTRSPEVAEADELEGLFWPAIARDEFESAKRKLIKQLRSQVKLLAVARGSRLATDVEVRDALRLIVIGRRQTLTIRVCRILSVLAILGGGAALAQGWATKDPLLAAIGVGCGLLLTAFQELLLHFRR